MRAFKRFDYSTALYVQRSRTLRAWSITRLLISVRQRRLKRESVSEVNYVRAIVNLCGS